MELSPDNTPHSPTQPFTLRLQISVNAVLWMSIGTIAAVLRFGRLGRPSLSPAEAVEAWRVWLFWLPDGSVLLDTYSPAYFSFTALLTQLIGFSDLTMRLVPAAAGLAAVLLIYRWRPIVGDLGSLVAALWVAISPVLVFQSRHAGGDALALLAVVVAGGTIWRLFVERVEADRPLLRRRSLLVAAGAAAAGLATTPLFYTGILSLAAAAFWADRSLAALAKSSEEPRPGRLGSLSNQIASEGWGPPMLTTAGVAFLVASSLFLWHLPGLGETANVAAGWVSAFQTALEPNGWLNLFMLAGRYELLLLVSALIAAIWAVVAAPPLGRALALWFGIAVLVAGLQNSSTAMMGAVVLPAAVILGYAAEQLRRYVSQQGESYWIGAVQVAALLTLLLLISAANLGRYARISFFDPADVAHLLLALLCLLIMIFMFALVTVWDPPLGLAAGMITLLLAGLVVQWGIAWRVGVTGISDHRYTDISLITADEFGLFVETTRETARELRGAEQAVSLFSAIDHPLLRWYLRDFDRARFGTAVPVEATYDLIISSEAIEPSFGADYFGSDFTLLTSIPERPAGWLARLRAFLFTERPLAAEEVRAILWVRADLLHSEGAAFP